MISFKNLLRIRKKGNLEISILLSICEETNQGKKEQSNCERIKQEMIERKEFEKFEEV